MKRAIIIGSGIGGLGTACLLAKRGYRVTVLEKNAQLGGRANIFHEQGYTFDMGPSWYLMPDIFAHFFELMGERVEDYLDLRKLDPSYRIFFKDKQKVIDLCSNLEKDHHTIEKLERGASHKLDVYLKRSEAQYAIAKDHFMYKNYDSIFDFFTWETLIHGTRLSVFQSMHRYVSRFFKSDEMQKVMEYQLVFLGSSPYKTPALYNIMNFIDFKMGVFYPMGGIYEIIKALIKIAEKYHVSFRTEAAVKRIVIEDARACAVELESGETLLADEIISNADIVHTEMNLLPEEAREHTEEYWKTRVMAPSAFILYLGVDGKIPSLTHHNLVFSQDWQKNFSEIFDDPRWPSDPSFYVCAPSVTDASLAPSGKENLFVLVPIPAGLEYNQADLELYANKILMVMEQEMNIPDLRKRIEFQRIFCTKEFAQMYNSYQGTALGFAHTLKQTAVFRPNNISKKVKNLYYVGAGTNPGIGMPICLISAELVLKRLLADKSTGPLKTITPLPESST